MRSKRNKAWQMAAVAAALALLIAGSALGVNIAGSWNVVSQTEPSFKFAVLTDTHEASKNTELAIKKVIELNPDFVIVAGDMVNDDAGAWEQVIGEIVTPLGDADIGFFPVRGNHDEGYKDFWEGKSYVTRSISVNSGGKWPNYYSFDYKNNHFVVLDGTGLSIGETQFAWLKQDLENAKGNYENIFIFAHEQLVNLCEEKACSGTMKPHKELVKLFQDTGVTIYFHGHQHFYAKVNYQGINIVNSGYLANYKYTLKSSVEQEQTFVLAEVHGPSLVTVSALQYPFDQSFDESIFSKVSIPGISPFGITIIEFASSIGLPKAPPTGSTIPASAQVQPPPTAPTACPANFIFSGDQCHECFDCQFIDAVWLDISKALGIQKPEESFVYDPIIGQERGFSSQYPAIAPTIKPIIPKGKFCKEPLRLETEKLCGRTDWNLYQPISGTKYAEIINKYAKQEGLNPALVQAVMDAESGGYSDAISVAGAVGLMQFIYSTANAHEYKTIFGEVTNCCNLEPGEKTSGSTFSCTNEMQICKNAGKPANRWCEEAGYMCTPANDGRFNEEKSIHASIKLLKSYIGKFEGYQKQLCWGIAGYNAGPGAVNGKIKNVVAATGKNEQSVEFCEAIDSVALQNYAGGIIHKYQAYAPSVS